MEKIQEKEKTTTRREEMEKTSAYQSWANVVIRC